MADVASFPYFSIPREARWREVVAGRAPHEIDPHFGTGLRIDRTQKVASAGSCFAQRISESLQAGGYNYFVTEQGPPFASPARRKELGYGVYSARYGNIYTAAQLLQTFRRAFGGAQPAEPIWRLPEGGWVDPFRPSVQLGGFDSERECLLDRASHLAAVRRMFEQVDVFVFTLGLTEAWLSLEDGAVFPSCPGSVLGGAFDPARHAFHNFSVAEVGAQLDAFLAEFRAVNPSAQVILTVSPVPLAATFEPRHVLQSTVYSKSVLRVAAEEAVRRHGNAHYFASYEIVLASGDSGAYFLDDRRTVSDAAVRHVIDCFHRQFTGDAAAQPATAAPMLAPVTDDQPMCDEERVMAALAAQMAAQVTTAGNAA